MTAAEALPFKPKPSELSMEIVRVTPSMAEKMLGRNIRNRNLRQRDVTRWAKSMTAGEWLITGEAIKLSYAGDLLDGQHRLAAVIESGRTVPMLVIKGLHPETQDVMDTGRARTAADMLFIHGFENSHVTAAAARVIICYETGLFYKESKSQAVSHRQIGDFATGNHLLAFVASRAGRIARAADMQPSIVAATAYVLYKVDAEAAEVFFERLADGAGLPAGSPILASRERLFDIRRNRVVLPMEAKVALVFRTWNAWRAGRKLSTLPLYKAGQLVACPVPK